MRLFSFIDMVMRSAERINIVINKGNEVTEGENDNYVKLTHHQEHAPEERYREAAETSF